MGWAPDILKQLDDGHRLMFPAILTQKAACDRKVITLLRGRTAGNSSSRLHDALCELHTEAWMRSSIHYLGDCRQYQLRMERAVARPREGLAPFDAPPALRPMFGPRWLVTCYSYESLERHKALKAQITSVYGRVLKLDSTKKVKTASFGRKSKLRAESSKFILWQLIKVA